MTIFRHLFLISCIFCIFHRNRFTIFMPMRSKYVFTQQIIKEMAKICFNTLKIIVVKYGEIWFPWRNVVLCSMCPYALQVTQKYAMHNLWIYYMTSEAYKTAWFTAIIKSFCNSNKTLLRHCKQHVTHLNKELKSIQYSLAKVINHTNVYICTISHRIHVWTQ